MIKNKKQWIFIIMGIFLVWIIGSAYIYTCVLKGFCQNQDKYQVKNNQVIKEDVSINYNDDKNIITKTFKEPLKQENIEIKTNTKEVSSFKRRTIKCYTHINSIIKINSNRNIESEVVKLENFFNDYYGEKLNIDGYFGKEDMDAVKRFQKNKNLDIDGIVGPKTLEIINAVYCVKNEKK